MIQDIGAADVCGEGLSVVRLGVASQPEGALKISVEVAGPWHLASVAVKPGTGARYGERPELRGVGAVGSDGDGADGSAG